MVFCPIVRRELSRARSSLASSIRFGAASLGNAPFTITHLSYRPPSDLTNIRRGLPLAPLRAFSAFSSGTFSPGPHLQRLIGGTASKCQSRKRCLFQRSPSSHLARISPKLPSPLIYFSRSSRNPRHLTKTHQTTVLDTATNGYQRFSLASIRGASMVITGGGGGSGTGLFHQKSLACIQM